MATRMKVSYDREGDVLHIDATDPYLAQETDVTDDWLVVRTNPETGAVENVEILDFSQRFSSLDDELQLPFAGQFSAIIPGAHAELRPAANE